MIYPNQSNELWEIQQAWELAWQTRFCPPDNLLTEQNISDEMQGHLKSCPNCAQRLKYAKPDNHWPNLASASLCTDENGADDRLSIQPGQIWKLSHKLAAWGPKARYYNPPVVIILRTLPSLPGGMLVAQTYHHAALMGADDALIHPNRFAEPWNIYAMHRGYLWRLCGQTGKETAERILAASRGEFDELPLWSPLYLFRQMEIELGFFFAASAAFLLMGEYEALSGDAEEETVFADLAEAPAELVHNKGSLSGMRVPPDLESSLHELGLRLPEDKNQRQAADLYFLAAPPSHATAMAAAQVERDRQVPVLAYCLRANRPVAWHCLQAEVTDFLRSPKVSVGGRLCSSLPPGNNWQAEFRWLDDSGRMVKSQASYLERKTEGIQRFWAYFPVEAPRSPFKMECRLFIRLFEG